MATYQQIIDKINGITDNGNNTAAEVRSVLTDILNYNDTEAFEVATADMVETQESFYHYSFRGIKKQCCNLYFIFSPKAETATTGAGSPGLILEISQADFDLLSPFIPVMDYTGGKLNNYQGYLAYIVPESQRGTPKNMNIVLIKYQGKLYLWIMTTLGGGESIMTAVAVNYKPFKFTNLTDVKNEAAAFTKGFEASFKAGNIK
ncbi:MULTISPECIES: hypothetical protein [unclassified Flavobacterium]|uniref:hypothetical protein n=1 Tax=unclassified Flavobacterium TaxID=196869 RepID=UPI0036105E96